MRNNILYSLVFFLIAISNLSFTPPNEIMRILLERLEFLTKNFPHEKVYIHTDKPHYTLGDTIWYSLTATDASIHSQKPVSGLVYVQIIGPDSSVIVQKGILLNEQHGSGEIAIDPKWKPGVYLIQAYTNYMRNYHAGYVYTKELMIWDAATDDVKSDSLAQNKLKENLKVSFFPEGGDMVEGLESIVAFEAKYENGSAADGEMYIEDEQGQIIVQTATLHEGRGFFSITPTAAMKYTAVMKDSKLNLPPAKKKGYGIRINNRSKDVLSVTLQTNEVQSLQGCFLIGHIRGVVFLSIDSLSGASKLLKIGKAPIPTGVAQFTLFNKEGMPLCERAVFLDGGSTDVVKGDISLSYAYQNTRSKTDVVVRLKDNNSNGLKGNFSVSVFDKNNTNFNAADGDIRTFFLLTSDLTKHIPNPGYYFLDDSPKRKALLDLVMMTHAWTRFRSDFLITQADPVLAFAPESGFVIRGTVLKNGRPLEDAKVDLVVLSDDYIVNVVNTDRYGHFVFDELPIFGKQTVTLKASESQANGAETSESLQLIVENLTQRYIENQNIYTNGLKQNFNIVEYLKKTNEQHKYDSLYTSMSVQLDEVTVRSSKKRRAEILKKERNIPYNNFDKRFELDSLPYINPNWTVYDLVAARSPGVQVIGNRATGQKFRIRGSNSINLSTTAQVLVDGAPVTDDYAASINIHDVEFIDIVRGLSSSSIFGSQGANGIVAIYLRKDRGYAKNAFTSQYQSKVLMDGYHQAREFYSPDYSTSFAGAEKPDLRTTLYWSPLVRANENGNAYFSFFTGDSLTDYIIDVQGMTSDGRPFVIRKEFQVKK